jgi:DNA modification methylase
MIKLYRGDCLKILRRLLDASVQCCVTSPPYWGLRDYGVAGQLGLETTPEAYVARMVEVFAEVRRVLRPDGTLWLNIGDSYAGSGKGGNPEGSQWPKFSGREASKEVNSAIVPIGLKPKDLVGVPWRLAFALQADGWYLRSDIIWHKPNPMPESVRDRPTKAHEYVFLLSKSERYFWDQDAVREQHAREYDAAYGSPKWLMGIAKHQNRPGETSHQNRPGETSGYTKNFSSGPNPGGRNIRSVWTITPKPFSGAHFATFPPALVERCVQAGTSEAGCCPQCGKPWERVTKRPAAPASVFTARNAPQDGRIHSGSAMNGVMIGHGQKLQNWRDANPTETLGFRPACNCPAADPVPCVVLDPFVGSGTTAAVARSLGRDCVGIDLNPKYLTMARQRVKVALCG